MNEEDLRVALVVGCGDTDIKRKVQQILAAMEDKTIKVESIQPPRFDFFELIDYVSPPSTSELQMYQAPRVYFYLYYHTHKVYDIKDEQTIWIQRYCKHL